MSHDSSDEEVKSKDESKKKATVDSDNQEAKSKDKFKRKLSADSDDDLVQPYNKNQKNHAAKKFTPATPGRSRKVSKRTILSCFDFLMKNSTEDPFQEDVRKHRSTTRDDSPKIKELSSIHNNGQ